MVTRCPEPTLVDDKLRRLAQEALRSVDSQWQETAELCAAQGSLHHEAEKTRTTKAMVRACIYPRMRAAPWGARRLAGTRKLRKTAGSCP